MTQAISLADVFTEFNLPDVFVAHCTFDSTQAQKHSVYVALNSPRVNRETRIEQAIAQGVSAIIVKRTTFACEKRDGVVYLHTPDVLHTLAAILKCLYSHDDLHVHGVTGTNGKTTVCWHIAALLDALENDRCAMLGTLGAGSRMHYTPTGMTTPEIIELHSRLRQFQQDGHKNLAMEVSAHAIDQGRITGLNFATKVFTNLSHDHLDYFGNMQAYQTCKQSWLTQPETATVVVNIDDPCGQQIHQDVTSNNLPSVSYSLQDQAADVYASNITQTAHGIHAQVHHQQYTAILDLPFFGLFNLANCLAAIGALLACGYKFPQLAQVANTLTLPPGRMHAIDLPNGNRAVIDYAHTPDALLSLLTEIKAHTKNTLVVVFGCGGERDQHKRPKMGKVASEYADAIWITSDNSRSESFDTIASNIADGIKTVKDVHTESDRAQAIIQALDYTLTSDDRTLVIAGKGHETTQEIGDQIMPFDDAAVVQNALRAYHQAMSEL